MNLLQQLARKIIKIAFDFSVTTIERFSAMDSYIEKLNELRTYEAGTLGKEIANCLDHHHLNLVPNYESHDLKHVLLNYEMTAEGEIRLQAFMIGNGNYSIPSFAIFIFGALLLPDLWKTFYLDFKKGRQSKSIVHWTIDAYGHYDIQELRASLTTSSQESSQINVWSAIIRIGAFATTIAGLFGMLYCLPHLFSSNMADLVGAGFPFVGGAILVAGGLLSLSNMQTAVLHRVKH